MKELFHYYQPGCRYNPSWHYAHGDAENFLGHDIPVTPDDWTPPVGRSFVILFNALGEGKKAACYSWISVEKSFFGEQRTQRGLFVFPSDRESVLYAWECMVNQVGRL